MRLEEMKCKACGAKLNVPDDAESVTCPYCNVTYKVQDMEDSGYEFEKGRIKAQQEHIKSLNPMQNKLMFIPIIIIPVMIISMIVFSVVTDKKGGSNKNKVSTSSFNSGYNSGRTPGVFVEDDLNAVIESNKTNKDLKITVKCDGKETSNPEEIAEIKKSLDLSIYYEITLDYDDEGYIKYYTIEVAEKTKEEKESEARQFNFKYLNKGTWSGFHIGYDLDDVINSNDTNKDKQITVKYNDIESNNEEDIKNIKSKLKTHTDYEVKYEYDEDGYIKKYIIEDK